MGGYSLVHIPTECLEPLGWAKLPEGATLWMYVPDGHDASKSPGVELKLATFQHPILQTYVDVCIEGCLEYSPEFAKELITTSNGWDAPWLNDRPVARRPWCVLKKYDTIDLLLKS